MFKTHVALGFLIGLVALGYLDIKNKFIFLIIVTIASCLPDIDHAKSKINNKVFLLRIFSFLFRHRGIMHSIFTAGLFGVLAYYYINADIAYGIFIGFTAHLIGDALTMNGIEVLYPLTRIKIRGFIRTGGIMEKAAFCIILLGIVYRIAAAHG